MALTQEQYQEVKKELDECKRPFIFYDDDQDGICSFLQLYKYKKEGKGFIVKTSPRLNEKFAKIANDYQPDKIFVLDIAVLEDEFIQAAKAPIIWIDHHGPYNKQGVKYFNPKVENKKDNLPTSYLCYQVVKQDLWLATLGCVSDWFIPDFMNEFRTKYPELVPTEPKHPGEILFGMPLGKLSRIISFNLKGKSEEVSKSIKTMIKISEPEEILNQTTPAGKFIYKRFEHINKDFEPLMEQAHEKAKEDDVVVFTYSDDQTSFTSDISNVLTYEYPEKTILVCREKNGEMKCSLRSSTKVLPPILEKAMIGLQGQGGGHDHACGLNIIVEHFDEFVEKLRIMSSDAD